MAVRRNHVTVSWKGLDRLERKLIQTMPQEVEEGTLEALEALGLMVQNNARQSVLKGPKTGHAYKRRTVSHQASAPGQPPASDTGTLVRSILSEVQRRALEVIISAGTAYAKMLEYGTRHMAARPFMLPALDKVRDIASRVVASYVGRKLRGL